MSHGSIQAPLMTIIILFEIFILDELSIPLVDTVVGQVREFVAFAVGGFVLLARKSSEAFVVYVDP
jgi:hypothetical protein